MNKAIILVCMFLASMALTACSIEDNPIEDPTTVNIESPQNEETEQPAYAPGL